MPSFDSIFHNQVIFSEHCIKETYNFIYTEDRGSRLLSNTSASLPNYIDMNSRLLFF
jgi:hypothetical protein